MTKTLCVQFIPRRWNHRQLCRLARNRSLTSFYLSSDKLLDPASTAIRTIRDTDWGPLSQYYAAFRLTNLLALNRKIQDRVEELGFDLEDARRVAPKVGFLWIDKASLEEDDDLQTMWANLMVSALHPNGAQGMGDFELETTFIEIASQFSPLDCQVLEYIVEHGMRYRNGEDEQGGKRKRPVTVLPLAPDTIFNAFPDSLAHISVEKLVYLGCAYRERRTVFTPESRHSYDIVPTLIGANLAISASGNEPSWMQEGSP